MGVGKPRGIQAARKLRVRNGNNRWADKQYNKRALGTAFKYNPFGVRIFFFFDHCLLFYLLDAVLICLFI